MKQDISSQINYITPNFHWEISWSCWFSEQRLSAHQVSLSLSTTLLICECYRDLKRQVKWNEGKGQVLFWIWHTILRHQKWHTGDMKGMDCSSQNRISINQTIFLRIVFLSRGSLCYPRQVWKECRVKWEWMRLLFHFREWDKRVRTRRRKEKTGRLVILSIFFPSVYITMYFIRLSSSHPLIRSSLLKCNNYTVQRCNNNWSFCSRSIINDGEGVWRKEEDRVWLISKSLFAREGRTSSKVKTEK